MLCCFPPKPSHLKVREKMWAGLSFCTILTGEAKCSRANSPLVPSHKPVKTGSPVNSLGRMRKKNLPRAAERTSNMTPKMLMISRSGCSTKEDSNYNAGAFTHNCINLVLHIRKKNGQGEQMLRLLELIWQDDSESSCASWCQRSLTFFPFLKRSFFPSPLRNPPKYKIKIFIHLHTPHKHSPKPFSHTLTQIINIAILKWHKQDVPVLKWHTNNASQDKS